MSIGGTPGSDSFAAAGVRLAVRTMLMLSMILIAAPYFAVDIAQAHGGGPGLGYDPCMRQAGTDDFIHLAVYQPEFNPFAEYCGALPEAGRTMLVFDLMGAELPDADFIGCVTGGRAISTVCAGPALPLGCRRPTSGLAAREI